MTQFYPEGQPEGDWEERGNLSWSELDWQQFLFRQEKEVARFLRFYDECPAAANERLRDLARSDDDMEATVAIWAAVKIDPQDASLFASAVPLLERALGSERELARYEAAVALGDMGAAAAAAAPRLEVVAADDPSRTVREAAAAALGRIAPR